MSTRRNSLFCLIGHKGRIFDVKSCTSFPNLILSSSEDGNAILWEASSKKLLFTFRHDLQFEVLRSCFVEAEGHVLSVCTCGSDGNAIIWHLSHVNDSPIPLDFNSSHLSSDVRLKYKAVHTFQHGESQVYSCESCRTQDHAILITAAENFICVWNLSSKALLKLISFDVNLFCCCLQLDNPVSLLASKYSEMPASGDTTPNLHFSKALTDNGLHQLSESQTPFGGPRNPDNVVYIFDVKLCPMDSNLVAVALSDGTVRFLNISQGQIESAIPLRPPSGDDSICIISSVAWDPDGLLLIASMGSGHVATIDFALGKVAYVHAHASTCFGAAPLRNSHTPTNDLLKYFITWSSDSFVRLWSYQRNPEVLPKSAAVTMVKHRDAGATSISVSDRNCEVGGLRDHTSTPVVVTTADFKSINAIPVLSGVSEPVLSGVAGSSLARGEFISSEPARALASDTVTEESDLSASEKVTTGMKSKKSRTEQFHVEFITKAKNGDIGESTAIGDTDDGDYDNEVEDDVSQSVAECEECVAIFHHDFRQLPGQAIYSCDVMQNGWIVCGSGVAAGGGGRHSAPVFMGSPVHVLRSFELPASDDPRNVDRQAEPNVTAPDAAVFMLAENPVLSGAVDATNSTTATELSNSPTSAEVLTNSTGSFAVPKVAGSSWFLKPGHG